MGKESWKPVVGYEGYYEVSDFGRIRSLIRKGCRINRILKTPSSRSGYPSIDLSIDNQSITHNVHCLVMRAFVGPCPIGHQIRHMDGSTINNHLSNLQYGTPKQNADDRDRHNTTCAGSEHHSAKLTTTDIIKIRRLLFQKMSQRNIAKMFGVRQCSISDIATRKTWRRVNG